MTGFEVVGVVLAVLPLLVTALEHYADGISTLKNMRDYESVVETLVTSFSLASAIYRNSCENLLRPLMLADIQFCELLNDPGAASSWVGEDLSNKLRERLGSSYPPYVSSVKQLNKRIDLFKKKLNLDNDMKVGTLPKISSLLNCRIELSCQPSWIKKDGSIETSLRQRFFHKPWRHIKIGFDTNKFASLLVEIEHDINQIDMLTRGSIALEPQRLERKRQDNAMYWLEIRNHARRLYESINLRWLCACQHPHRANLRLDLRRRCEVDEASVRFGILFSFDVDGAGTMSLPWNWRDVEIEPFKAPSQEAKLATLTHPSSKKTVSFDLSSAAVSSSSVLTTQSLHTKPPSPPRINSLCEILGQSPQTICCLGFLDHQSWQHYIYTTNQRYHSNQMTRAISLHDVLKRESLRSLTIKDKYKLAFTLASAVLQLHATPWLNDSWDMADIYFVRDGKGTSTVGQPYVSSNFASIPKSQQSTRMLSRSFVQNEMIFALGVALLELSYGQPITSFKTAEDLDHQGNETIFTEYSIANRLSKEIDGPELPLYVDAVTRCIRCNFDTNSTSLEDTAFLQHFYQGVVIPLQKLHDFANSNK